MNLEGKVAIVTGGARGLGRGFAEALLERGASVVIVDILAKVGLHTVNQFNGKYGVTRAMYMNCDVTNEEDFRRVFRNTKSQYGNIDIVVNNAGIAKEDMWRKMIEINLNSVIVGTHLALEYMNKDNGGRGGLIVNTGSTAGLTSVPHDPVYAATKHGVVGFTRSIAERTYETIEQNIRLACLCPSFTGTEMVLQMMQLTEKDDEHPEIFKEKYSDLGLMKPERVVEAFMKIVDNPNNNGGIMAVIPQSMEYKFPRHLRGKL